MVVGNLTSAIPVPVQTNPPQLFIQPLYILKSFAAIPSTNTNSVASATLSLSLFKISVVGEKKTRNQISMAKKKGISLGWKRWMEVAPPLFINPRKPSNSPQLETIFEENNEGQHDAYNLIITIHSVKLSAGK